jgi:hypothetical protein
MPWAAVAGAVNRTLDRMNARLGWKRNGGEQKRREDRCTSHADDSLRENGERL